ncbi:hypothetical protein [Pseudonocardia sp. KRD291]|uniref:hypothetical protein n=1 Tax=Pseudonocardia sp. KRD291 TaxID=2792007 RepID=UPI001C4A3D1D|nr:hypothetical protein [Pseudonocardia sp. KRD291]MBW0101774.1 hypothetical protein [Pseudonocardia sp. KRD291]
MGIEMKATTDASATTRPCGEAMPAMAAMLVREFMTSASPQEVCSEVRNAARDLHGQIAPESLPEMAYRLVRGRLLRRVRGGDTMTARGA